jgi:hypothetical protein
MVALQAFVGLLPATELCERSVDGSERGAARLARRRSHPRHVAWLEGTDEGPPADVDAWVKDGSLIEDAAPVLRVVEQQLVDGRRVVGLLGLARLHDLVPHEGTDPKAVRRRIARDRLQTVDSRPLLAVLPADPPGAAALISIITARAPELDVIDEGGVTHRSYTCRPYEADQLTAMIAELPCLLADGHHRAAAAAALHRLEVPTLIAFAGFAPRLLPVWRVAAVTRAAAAAVHAWMDQLPDIGDVVVRFDGRVRRAPANQLELPVSATKRYADAVPHVQRVTSTSDVGAVSVAQRDGAVVIGSDPPTVTEVLGAVAAGHPLPPKSTSFDPKPRVGLVMHRVVAPGGVV